MGTGTLPLRLRWSWRDLRQRWLVVMALALVVAIGTGTFAGLGGTSAWRLRSNDASYAALRMHDLRVELPDGGFVPAGTLAAAARGIEDASSIAALEERLVVPAQVDASTGSRSILVSGEVVGMPASAGGAPVDRLFVAAGRGLLPTDEGEPVAVLESKFADHYGLPATGTVLLGGGRQLRYVGTGYTPEYFRVIGRSGQLLGETSFAVLFVPLSSAQGATGHAGRVNDLVLRVESGAERDRVQAQLAAAVAGLGGSVTNRDDDPVHRGLYEDARNDQRTWDAFAALILLGAALAVFNLVIRMIEAQRRELGVGMALGVTPRALATRPLLVGVQVAVLGVAAGVGVGWLIALAMRRELERLLPLPVWLTPFPTGRFLQAAALGLAIPVAGTLLALRRVLRLEPVDAIRSGAFAGAGRPGRLAALLRRVRLPGRSYASMPVRDAVRAPRRTALTAIGIAASITCFVAVLGLLDSFFATGDRSAAELGRTSPDRLTVTLADIVPVTSPTVADVTGTPGVGRSVTELRLPTTVSADGRTLDAITTVLDLANPVWAPSLVAGDPATAARGILLSEEAAADLHVRPGDTVQLRHPERTATGFRLETTSLLVAGLHPDPMRPLAYLDASWADLFGLAGTANVVTVVPAPGTTQDGLLRSLFERPGVAAVERTTGLAELITERLGEFTGILRVIELVTLLLALLIAFNSASLGADERAREQATMFAFGLPPRTVLAMGVAEHALVGAVGTLLGVGLGELALRWIVSGFDTVLPDLAVDPVLSRSTVAATAVLGVLVVALAPLLTARRLRRMDVPSTLRVVE